jgi:enoyl-CoA hydratase/carnithine racemase
MSDIRCDWSNNILRVRIARGKGNALSGSLIDALIAAVDEVAREP